MHLEKKFLTNFLQYLIEFVQKAEGYKKYMMENLHQGTYYVGYNKYLLNYVVNSILYILPINHMGNRVVNNPMKNKKYSQFYMACICFSYMHINEPMSNAILGLHKETFG